MKKKISRAFGKTIYLIGRNEDGTNYWLEEPSWDCGWYWGFGYLEAYTNNRYPHLAKDIIHHTHFDYMFFNKSKCARDAFKEFFKETPLSDSEIWELCDYMKTFYTLQSVANLFNEGYSHQTSKAKIDKLQDKNQEDLVNKVWLPEVFKRIIKILSPKED